MFIKDCTLDLSVLSNRCLFKDGLVSCLDSITTKLRDAFTLLPVEETKNIGVFVAFMETIHSLVSRFHR